MNTLTRCDHSGTHTTAKLFLLIGAALIGADASGEALFEARLDVDLQVDTPRILQKFGYATSFPSPPKPADGSPRPKNPRGAFTGATNGIAGTLAGGTWDADRRNPPGPGRGLSLSTSGMTDAPPVLGAFATGEGWATGRTRARLGNFTGREGNFPDAEELEIDLSVITAPFLKAVAGADVESYDWASAKYHFEVINVDTGAVIVSTPPAPVMPIEQAESGVNNPAIAPLATPFTVTLPANTFTNIDLVGHVYASGYSIGVEPAFPPVLPPPAMVPFQQRAAQLFPDPQMAANVGPNPLMGNVDSFGLWPLPSLAAVQGEDPDAHAGMATIFMDQVIIDPLAPNDLLIEVEAPIEGSTILALDQMLFAPGGVQLFGMEQALGVGLGAGFQPQPDPQMLSFFGPQTQLPPQPLHGSLNPAGFSDEFAPDAIFYDGAMGPGQQSGLLSFVQVHDLIDGVVDGMARFTLRQFSEGISGDFDGDGQVTPGDYFMWAELYASGNFLADGNADGQVDAADYTIWRDRFDAALGGGFQVPEPGAAALGLIGFAAAGLRRRTR